MVIRWKEAALVGVTALLLGTVGVAVVPFHSHQALAASGDGDGDDEGYYWSSTTIPYVNQAAYVNDANAWSAGASAWNNSASKWYLQSVSQGGNIDLLDTNNSSVTWDGITIYNTSGSNFTSVTCYLNHYYTSGYTSAETKSVASHELGHALGLAHEKGAIVMNAYTCGSGSRWCTYGINSPTSDDVSDVNGVPNGG